MKNLMMKNKYKEIYLFYEYKNLIINSVTNIFNKEIKEKKEKDKQRKERERYSKEKERISTDKERHSKERLSKERHSKERYSKEKVIQTKEEEENNKSRKRKSISPECLKSKGIKGIIRVVTKKDNLKNKNRIT